MIEQLIQEYLAWCETQADAYEITKASSTQFKTVLAPFEAAAEEILDIISGSDVASVRRVANKPTLDGLLVWYNTVKNV